MAVNVTNFPTKITSTCDALLGDKNGLAIIAQCTGTPPATANVFAVGCIIQQTDGTNIVFENTGTSAAPVWTPLTVSGASGVLIADGNGTTLVRLSGSPASTFNGIVTAFEVISLDNASGGITLRNGCTTQAITVQKGSNGQVTGCTGSSMPFSTAGCLGAVSDSSGRFVVKAYFSTPTIS